MIVQPLHTTPQRIERPSPTSLPNKPASIEPAQSFSRVYSEAAELDRIRKRKEIMSNYDMTNMSINEFEKMAKQLYDAGTLSEEEFIGISLPIFAEWIFDEQRSTLIPITDKNKKRNYLEGFRQSHESIVKYIPDDIQSINHSRKVMHLAESLHLASGNIT
ncbi:MAG: hypothetical protein Q4B17_13035 [Lautropia sp.]|nr:hypothetical protein [Lautropia sp.]